MCGEDTKETYLEILCFRQFYKHTYKRKIYEFQEYVNVVLHKRCQLSKYFDLNDKRTIGGFSAVLC